MELDELKVMWQDYTAHEEKVDKQALKTLLKGKSNSVIAKLRRSMLIEIIVGLITLPIIIHASYQQPIVEIRMSLIPFYILVLLAVLFFSYKYKSTSNIIVNDENLVDNLKTFTQNMETLLKNYLRLNFYFIPLILIPSALLGFAISAQAETERLLRQKETVIALGAAIIALSILMIPYVKWYGRFFYGKYLKQLNEYLQELEENEIL